MERCALPSGGVMENRQIEKKRERRERELESASPSAQLSSAQLRERCVHERAWNTDATVQGCRSCSLAGPRETLRPSDSTVLLHRRSLVWVHMCKALSHKAACGNSSHLKKKKNPKPSILSSLIAWLTENMSFFSYV